MVSATDRIATKLHHFELLNSCYVRLKSKTFTLLKDIIFKASFKSLFGIHFKKNFTVKSGFVPTWSLYSRQCKCRAVQGDLYFWQSAAFSSLVRKLCIVFP